MPAAKTQFLLRNYNIHVIKTPYFAGDRPRRHEFQRLQLRRICAQSRVLPLDIMSATTSLQVHAQLVAQMQGMACVG